jgi:acyl carrier protein
MKSLINIAETIRKYIVEEVMFEKDESILGLEDPLLESNIIDSPNLVYLVAFLDEEFNVDVPPEDLVPENFESVQAISIYLSKLVGNK